MIKTIKLASNSGPSWSILVLYLGGCRLEKTADLVADRVQGMGSETLIADM